MVMSETDLLKDISEKLDNILKLLAINTVKAIETEQGKIDLLDQLGFRPVEIANFLSKSPDNINVQLNIIRKKKEKTVKPKISQQDNTNLKTKEVSANSQETLKKS